MNINKDIDANQTEASSTSVEVTPESQDAKEGAESSAAQTQETDAKEATSPESIIEAAAATGEEEESTESSPEETAEAKAETNSKEAEASESDQENAKVPFHEHPRWQEKLQEVETLKQQAESVKPQLERLNQLEQFIQANNITQEQFSEVMNLAAALNNDPAKAWSILEPKLSVLAQFNGNQLPEDLQKEVDDGVITEARAKEIAKYRAGEKVNASRAQVTAEQQQQQAMNNITKAVVDWDTAERAADPTFKPKADGEPDGAWEFTRMAFNEKLRSAKDFSPQAIVRYLVESKASVKKSFAHVLPAKKPMRTLTATGTTAKTKPTVNSSDDIIEAFARGETVPRE